MHDEFAFDDVRGAYGQLHLVGKDGLEYIIRPLLHPGRYFYFEIYAPPELNPNVWSERYAQSSRGLWFKYKVNRYEGTSWPKPAIICLDHKDHIWGEVEEFIY